MVLSCLLASPGQAHGSTASVLGRAYQAAVSSYEEALERESAHAERIAEIEAEAAQVGCELEESRNRLGESLASFYKNSAQPGEIIDQILSASSLHEAFVLYGDFTRIARYRHERFQDLLREQEQLNAVLYDLMSEREAYALEVEQARQSMMEAKEALRNASHSDGHKYHQVQGNKVNCGATAFIVGVNILLGENRYTDNVEVWAGPGFEGDSTQNLAEKGRTWLEENSLSDQLSFADVPGDIHETGELREQLEEGNIVVISSGADSVWQRADDSEGRSGLFPSGHWIVFYCYEDGVFYANDSSVSAKKGAGVPYTESQMQEWLDGRANHYACVLEKASTD